MTVDERQLAFLEAVTEGVPGAFQKRRTRSISPGEKPMSAKLEPTSDTPVTFKNWRLVSSDMATTLVRRAQVRCRQR